MSEKTRIGIFGIGLDTYWDQFEGLKDRLIGYQNEIASKVKTFGVEMYDAGLVDNPQKAQEAAIYFRENRVEAILLYISTYALSHTVLPVLQKIGVPLMVLNVQPVAAIDYEKFNAMGDRGKMTGDWLAHCQACSMPEIANVCNRAGIDYELVTGYLQEDYVWDAINEWISAVKVKVALSQSRLGILGHYYCGMLDVYTDITLLSAVFGSHFEIIEMDELVKLRTLVSDDQVANKRNEFEATFKVSPECEEYELDRAAKTSVALDILIETKKLNGMAYYYEGVDANDSENVVTSVIAGNTLLTAKNTPIAGECEVKNVVAMKILDLFGAGGSFSELYAADFNDDVVLWGHDGPAHIEIAEGDVGLVPLPIYHGKPGKGLSIQMSVKNGPVTLLSVVQGAEGKTFLLVAEAESVPGPTLQIGNTNSRYKFSISARDFVNEWSRQGPAHHCAIGVGHIGSKLEKLAKLLNIDCIKIC